MGVVTGPRRAAATGRCATESPTATASSRTTPGTCARISFSIFIASTIHEHLPRLDGIALADLDPQHRALHRAGRLAPRPDRLRRRGAARRACGARPRAARSPAARPRRRSARRRPRPRSAAARRPAARRRVPPPGASASASSPSISPAHVSPAMNDGCCEDQPVQRRERWHALHDELVERAQHAQARALAVAVPDARAWRSAGRRRRPPRRSPRCPVDAHARPRGSWQRTTRPGAGRKPAPASSALMRHSKACPRSSTSACASGSGAPPAISICARTRSKPLTSSVTGCSTWMRVFISRK